MSPTASGEALDFTVVGSVNNQLGYVMTGQAKDGGPAGSGLDAVSITIRTGTGEGSIRAPARCRRET